MMASQTVFSLVLLAAAAMVASAGAPAGTAPPPLRYRLHGKVIRSEGTEKASFLASTRVMLDGGEHVTTLREDGTFVFVDLPSASYTLEVSSLTDLYAPLRVDVNKKFENNVRIFKTDFVSGAGASLAAERIPFSPKEGVVIEPLYRISWFKPVASWSPMSLVKNPMIWMMLLPLLLKYLMPSPEDLKKMQEEAGVDGSSSLQSGQAPDFDIAGKLAAMTSGVPSKPKSKLTGKR